MSPTRLPSALMALISAAFVTRTASALAVEHFTIHELLPRDTCGGVSGLSYCGKGLPTNFCCNSNDTCLVLNNTGIAAASLCCPAGGNCTAINPILCDISYQDADKYPQMPVHVSNTSQAVLPTCGNACCPLGYECVNGTQCHLKDITQQAPTSTASTSATTATPSGSSGIASMPTSSASEQPKTKTKSNVAGLVFAGLIPGLLVGALICFAILWYVRKRRERAGYKSDGASSFFGPTTPHPSNAPKISSPIYQPGMSDRTVFGHQRSASGNTINDGQNPFGSSGVSSKLASSTSSAPGTSSVRNAGRLDAPFESPVRPPRAGYPQSSVYSPSRRSSRRATRKTTDSMETISMLMGPSREPSYQQSPPVPKGLAARKEERQTTFSDVYRAVGVSPSKMGTARPSEDTQRYNTPRR